MRAPTRKLLDRAAFVCLFTGSKYHPEYVSKLYRAIRRNSETKLSFLCVTDREEVFEGLNGDFSVVPLRDPWPGWWNKIRLFDRRLTPYRYLVYVDLDVVILRSIEHLLDDIGRAELVHARDLIDRMSSSFMIIDTGSRLAADIVENFELAHWNHLDANDVNDQHYFERILMRSNYDTAALAWRDHYSYKYLIDHGEWRTRCTDRTITVIPEEQITMLNLHGYPKPHHIREAPDRWPYSKRILEHWSPDEQPPA